MKFEIPFDETIFKQQIELTFKTSWKKYATETTNLGLFNLVFILFAIIVLYGKGNDVGTVFLIIAIVGGISFFKRRNEYKNAKVETEKIMNETIAKWKENPTSTWEFEDEYFRFKNYGGDYKINWNNFKHYEVIDNTLMFGYEKNTNSFMLSETELGKENFYQIINFIESKIKTSR